MLLQTLTSSDIFKNNCRAVNMGGVCWESVILSALKPKQTHSGLLQFQILMSYTNIFKTVNFKQHWPFSKSEDYKHSSKLTST
jgi:hypothetical protein